MMGFQTVKRYHVAVDIILIVAVIAGYMGLRTALRPQSRPLPVFIGETVAVEQPVKVSSLTKAAPVARAQAKPAAKAAVQPLPEPRIVQPLPIVPPRVTFKVLPQYPVRALEQEIEGTTVLSIQVGLSGAAEDIMVKSSSGSAELDEAAKASVAQWKFSPATQGGTALASRFEVPVSFRLQ
ncbi:MAG: energy transducer TonB [Candidatus Saganbacteria bacterium]|nr:energy transducer TonB [Candidatus Saganbacteria bacterium]